VGAPRDGADPGRGDHVQPGALALLSGAAAGGHFDADEFRALEERVRAHTGHDDPIAAHALADPSGLQRGRELAAVTTPTLVIDAPLDPVFPPPHADHLARAIPTAHLTTIPGMGHALPAAIVPELADAILARTTTGWTEGSGRQGDSGGSCRTGCSTCDDLRAAPDASSAFPTPTTGASVGG
jgi:pimeloyl-ACP methyl ester carboxylesterase